MITVGVFDSGVGGLSVLRAEMPQVHFVYWADNAHGPYGERSAAVVIARTQRITEQQRQQNPDRPPIDTLVFGCTHYPFARGTLQALCGPGVVLVDTGEPVVARCTRAVLNLPAATGKENPASLTLLNTGEVSSLHHAAARWLGVAAAAG